MSPASPEAFSGLTQSRNATTINNTAAQLPSLAAHVLDKRQWPPGKGFWIGVGFFVCFIIVVLSVYSYLASPFWFVRIKRVFGFRPSKVTPISRRPLPAGLDAEENGGGGGSGSGTSSINRINGNSSITPPEPALLSPSSSPLSSSSGATLPQYRPSGNFSNDVLSGLLDLNVAPSSPKPPSYRSRLTLDVELMTRTTNARHVDRPMDVWYGGG